MYQVIKRDGKISEFDIKKIAVAVTKAFEASEKQYHPSIIDMLALKVTADFEPKIKDGKIAVEDIQDSVEQRAYPKRDTQTLPNAYILYRRQREKIRNMKSHHARLQKTGGQLCKGDRLAREGKFHRYLFGRRADPFQQRRHHGELLAFRNL